MEKYLPTPEELHYNLTNFTAREKGKVENRIGVIRRVFAKKTNFREVSKKKRSKEVAL